MHYNGQKWVNFKSHVQGVKWQNQTEQRAFSHLFNGTTKISTSITKSWSEVTPLIIWLINILAVYALSPFRLCPLNHSVKNKKRKIPRFTHFKYKHDYHRLRLNIFFLGQSILLLTPQLQTHRMQNANYSCPINLYVMQTGKTCQMSQNNILRNGLKVDVPILPCVFYTFNWLTLTSEMYFVRFHPEVTSCLLSRGKTN